MKPLEFHTFSYEYLLFIYRYLLDYNGNCTFTNIIAGNQEIALRKLDEFDIFIQYNNAIAIVHRVTNVISSFLIDIVSAHNPFGIDSSVRGKNQKSNDTPLTLYSSKGIGYISETGIKDIFQFVNSYNIFMGKILSEHLAETDENGQVKVISSMI